MFQKGARGTTSSARYRESAAEGAQDGMCGSDRHTPAGEHGRHVILVTGRQHASDHSDAERTPDLEGYSVGCRSYPGIALRNRSHQRVRSRR